MNSYTLLFIMASVIITSCSSNTDLKNVKGKINAHAATRGSLQYVISSENHGKTTIYYPINLQENFKVDGLEIQFDGEVLDSNVQIFKPGPTDIPEPDFAAKAIKLFAIKENSK
jgi:hypothetical protein